MSKKKIAVAPSKPATKAKVPSIPREAPETRYARVKRLLNTAAGDSTADYQGMGRFWNLPYQEFLHIEIYGVRMIAEVTEWHTDEMSLDTPEERLANSCCPVPLKTAQASATRILPVVRPGRGAGSGLIKGLKGEFPFNQEYFKPLPWGGQRMSEEDIEFISNWIDDGCPEVDYVEQPAVRQAAGQAIFKAYNRATNIFKREYSQLKVRKSIENLTDEEEEKLRNAVWEMVRLNVFPKDKRNMLYWGRLHGDECQHGWEQFLTWHRMFLYSFEQALQDIDPDVTLPYWDWTHPKYLKGQIPALLDKNNPAYNPAGIAGIIPRALRCWINQSAIQKLILTGLFSKDEIKKLESIKGQRFNAALELFNAAEIVNQNQRNAMYPELARVNPLWYQFRYPGMFYNGNNNGGTEVYDPKNPLGALGLQMFNHHFPTRDDIKRIMKVDNWRNFGGGPEYNQSFGILDYDPHNTIHLWTGGYNPLSYILACNPNNQVLSADPNEPPRGDMFNNLTAAFDFIFWPHHCNIDRLYSIWQTKYPNQLPDDQDAALPGLGFSVRDARSIGKLGYEYATDMHIFPTGRGLSLKSFQSDVIAITDELRNHDGKVELRLHNVDQPQYSFGLRVFLNQPDANVNTPTTGNPNYAGSASFFGHGDCIGGPGHCDPPFEEKRSNDLRGRNHNAPGNIPLDITEAFNRIKENSDQLEISVVLVDNESAGADLGLRMDALSINFLD
ncbi:MAG: tyrosinase family protein [Bacteroidia bacterium]|nr:tyrosinase family protein [Bacteroidia bacterium]